MQRTPATGTRSWNHLGNFPFRRIRRDRLGLVQDGKRRGGDYASGDVAGRFRVHLLSDPAGIRHVLVRNQRNYIRGEPEGSPLMRSLGPGLLLADGEDHLRQRRLLQPAFQPKRIAEYSAVVTEELERQLQEWLARPGAVVDVNHDMMRMTMVIIGRVLFDVDVSREAGNLGHSITDVNELALALGFSVTGWMPWLPTPSNLRLARAIRRLDRALYAIIEERRGSGLDRGDVLSILLNAQDEEASDADRARLSDEQVRNEALVLFAAGHETTANMLTWTWLLLAQHPEVEERLHEELDSVLGGRPARFEDLPALPFTERVMRESLRLYPPAWINGRNAVEPDEIEGHPVPARAILLMAPFLVHRDPRWWPEPERFDPDRFLPERERHDERPRFAYFPFGGGVRQCIGQSFAEMEGQLALATLAQHVTPRLLAGHSVELEPMITLRPRGGLPMRLEARG